MAAFRTSRIFDVCFIAIVGVGLGWAATHRTQVGDQIFFARYQPSPKTTAIASAAGLNDVGRWLFYRTDPIFDDNETITANCDIERLGCLNERQQAFILDDPDNPDQTTVTAAHEMLHLAYSRLTSNEKTRIAPLLDAAIAQFAADGLSNELSSETSTDNRREEAHSLLGTEYSPLSVELETYYKTYFCDRAKVLAAVKKSER